MQTIKKIYRKMIDPENLMWNISLAYTLIPILTNLGQPHFPIILLATLVFIFIYLAMIYLNNPVIEWLGWFYIVTYIITFTFISISMSMFVYYQTNLLTFRYQEKYSSIKWITVYLEVAILIIYAILAKLIHVLYVIGPIMISAFALHWTMKRILEQERLKEKIVAQNKSINTLLAENERNRISRDLHDTLGHVFSMLTIKSDLAIALLDQENIEAAKEQILSLQNITKETTKNVRRIIQDLQQQTIADELTIVEQLLTMAGIHPLIEGKELANQLKSHQQHILSMILRELVTNVLKHSRATQCQIQFEINKDYLHFYINDNGIGIEKIDGQELHTVKQRLSLLQATLDFISYQPVHIRIQIPLVKGSDKE